MGALRNAPKTPSDIDRLESFIALNRKALYSPVTTDVYIRCLRIFDTTVRKKPPAIAVIRASKRSPLARFGLEDLEERIVVIII